LRQAAAAKKQENMPLKKKHVIYRPGFRWVFGPKSKGRQKKIEEKKQPIYARTSFGLDF
jgi:hypothetical protein